MKYAKTERRHHMCSHSDDDAVYTDILMRSSSHSTGTTSLYDWLLLPTITQSVRPWNVRLAAATCTFSNTRGGDTMMGACDQNDVDT